MYVNIKSPVEFINYRFTHHDDYETTIKVKANEQVQELNGSGNGRLDAISNALQTKLGVSYSNLMYKEHALEVGSGSQAVSYVGITAADGKVHWGCGIDVDIMTSSVKALFSAVNNMCAEQNEQAEKQEEAVARD
ncbi:2-isopropylmalate synthase [compost metagenome]